MQDAPAHLLFLREYRILFAATLPKCRLVYLMMKGRSLCGRQQSFVRVMDVVVWPVINWFLHHIYQCYTESSDKWTPSELHLLDLLLWPRLSLFSHTLYPPPDMTNTSSRHQPPTIKNTLIQICDKTVRFRHRVIWFGLRNCFFVANNNNITVICSIP